MRIYFIEAIIPSPLGLQTMPFPSGPCLNIEHSVNSYIWKQPPKVVPWKMCSLKLGKPNTVNKDTNTLQWQTRPTSSSKLCKIAVHALRRSYRADFNAFNLYAQVRLLPELVKGSNLPSLYNWCLQTVACIKSSNHS